MSADLRLILVVIGLASVVSAGTAGLRYAVPALAGPSERLRLWLGRKSPRLGRYTETVRRDWAYLIVMALVILIGAFVFFTIAEDILEGDPSLAADRATYVFMRGLRTPAGDAVLTAVTELGDSMMVTTMGVVVAAWLIWRRAWRALVFWALAVAGGSILNTAIKLALHRTRPTDLYHAGWDVFSFPSGHSTTNAVLYGFLAVLIGRELPKHLRLPLACITASFVALIAFSRLYLGAHWLSDVMGGLAFGSAWVAVLAFLHAHGNPRPIGARPLLSIAVATLIVAGGVHIARHHAADLHLYAVRAAS
jgi:undecaprenyl-diphosphatase